MTGLDLALARLRDVALNRLAQREQLIRTVSWRRIALRQRRLPAALAMLRDAHRAGNIRRIWIWLVASYTKRP